MLTLKKFFLNERGATALLFGLLLIPLIGFLGLAIDSSRGYAVKHRLQESIDAAALAGARNFDSVDRDRIIHQYFEANWRSGFHITDTPVITVTADNRARTISVTGKVNMQTILMPAVGGTQVIEIGSVNTAYKDISFVELALALDTTTSMRFGTGASATIQPSNPANRRINIMKDAAVKFINGLYTQNGTVQETVDNLRVSLIPFTSMVNVGKQHTNFLASGSLTGLTWDYPENKTSQNSWRGCTFERSFYSNLVNGGTYPGHDVDDASPSVEPFYPYVVVSRQEAAVTACNEAASPTPPPPSPPSPPSPPAPPLPPAPPPSRCSDGVGDCLTRLQDMNLPHDRNRMLQPVAYRVSGSSLAESSSLQDGLINVGLGTVGGACVYGWSSYNIFERPVFATKSAAGFWIQAPSSDGVHSQACIPKLDPSNPTSDNCTLMPWGYTEPSGKVCCGGGYTAYNALGATTNGRWIAPWPNAIHPKLGGWGNSGCGMPIVPLSNSRSAIISAIEDLDVPLERPLDKPELGYNGTLINQGLVWAWRTLSPNWRGFWKDSGGALIETGLPKNYDAIGVSKAVVVMTDGVNFLPDQDPTSGWPYYTPFWKDDSVFSNSNETSVPVTVFPDDYKSLNISGGNMNNWKDVDNSAYGIVRRLYAVSGSVTSVDAEVSYCEQRAAAGFEPSLGPSGIGCRPYACMIRNSAGECLASSTLLYGLTRAQSMIGPYYDELMSRLVTTCNNMRADGVRVFFILFAINDNPQKASTMTALNKCIGSSGKLYDAADADQLNSAFADILAQVRRLSLTH